MLDKVQSISKLFYEIPLDYKRIDEVLEKERFDQRSLQEICEDVCGLLYDYEEGKLPYDQKSMAEHMIKAFERLIHHGLDINNEEDECFNVMFEVFMFRIPYVTPAILRYLIEQGGDPNLVTRYSNPESLYEYVYDEIFLVGEDVCDATVHSYLVLLGFGGRQEGCRIPNMIPTGGDIRIFREFERFEYQVDQDPQKPWVVIELHIFNKETKEEVLTV